MSDSVLGLTDTEATGTGITLTAADPTFPSTVAVTVAVPTATPVTSPADETVAIEGFEETQLTGRPERAPPIESFAATASCLVWVGYIVAVIGETSTLATGTGDTETVAVPERPSTVAEIEAAPGETAVTVPVDDTDATVASELVQATTLPEREAPEASLGSATREAA